MGQTWISLAEAYRRALEVLLSPHETKERLRAALIEERPDQIGIRAKAKRVVKNQQLAFEEVLYDEFIPRKIWKDAIVVWDDPAGVIYRPKERYTPVGSVSIVTLSRWIGEGVELLEADVMRLLRRLSPTPDIQPEPDATPVAEPEPPVRARRGRPPGSGLAKIDAPVVIKMHELITSGKARSRTRAAEMLSHELAGKDDSDTASRVRRLTSRYREQYGIKRK